MIWPCTALAIAALIAQSGVLPAQARACGRERWLVKTGADRDVGRVDTVQGATKVRVSTSNVDHCAGTRGYGATKSGYYATEAQASASGARPAYGRRCAPR